jgi:hypothetical protein
MLAMRGWIVFLATWWRLPVFGGIDELDQQIKKFRLLKDTYVRDIAISNSGYDSNNSVSVQRREECKP